MKHPLCSLNDVPATGVKTVDFFGRQAHVYRAADGEVKAALSICPHLGGPLELKDGKLVCPWHGAQFDATTGTCLHGPADANSKAMLLPTRNESHILTYVWGE
jgi:nitrite reductase/ring-hydroxylating ferredoxin subunit